MVILPARVKIFFIFYLKQLWFSTFGQTFKNWLSDAGAVLEQAAAESGGPVDVIGSSMGGLISLHLATVGSNLERAQFYWNQAQPRASAIALSLRASCSLPQRPNRACPAKPWRWHSDSSRLPSRLWLSFGFIFNAILFYLFGNFSAEPSLVCYKSERIKTEAIKQIRSQKRFSKASKKAGLRILISKSCARRSCQYMSCIPNLTTSAHFPGLRSYARFQAAR